MISLAMASGFVIQQHHVVAVPAHRTADVQQQAWHVEHGGGDLVGDHLGWVEVAGIRHSAVWRLVAYPM